MLSPSSENLTFLKHFDSTTRLLTKSRFYNVNEPKDFAEENFVIKKLISKGKFSSVYQVKSKIDNKFNALKVSNSKKLFQEIKAHSHLSSC